MSGKRNTPDLAGLRKFIRSTAGNAPPALVGRDTILADIEDAAQDTWQGFEDDNAEGKLLRTIVGAPGSGKTSILKHLCEKWNRAAVEQT